MAVKFQTNTITVNLTASYIKYYWRCVMVGEDGEEVISNAATTDQLKVSKASKPASTKKAVPPEIR